VSGNSDEFIGLGAVLENGGSLGVQNVPQAIGDPADDGLWVIGAAEDAADFEDAIDLFW
jgi:hypothetical protein